MKKGVILLLLSSLLLFVSCSKIGVDKLAANNSERVKKIANELIGDIDISLYFDGTKNEAHPKVEEQKIQVNGEEIVGQYLIQALIQGPSQKGSLAPILPKNTKLLSFDMKDDIAIINLSKEAVVNMSLAKEEATLKGIIATITQIPSIKKVNILIENQMINSLGGNFDISKPFTKEEVSSLKISK
ncbi:GerMN domain-containing protein [Clostridium sp.]|uniref:GerMN domain-containing protein n=1 Tax=Clostridium sp. TaxID=1506 RepID=UPI0026158DA5|nr:GerMN domain-containing protein [Clostridium sp.]